MIYNASRLNQHWPIYALAELGEFKRGKSRHRPRNDARLFEDGKYPLIQTGEIKEANLFIRNHSAKYSEFGLAQSELWPEGTLCITIAANIAETAILGYPMCFPDSVVGFLANKKVSSEIYMHYVFAFIRKSIQNSASGSIQDNINIEYLTGLRLRIPPKAYQDQLAKVLSTLDAKIELNHRINQELEDLAKLLYDYWFVQFDFPISAEQAAAMGDPTLQGKPYRQSGGKMTYNPTLKREIPVGWSSIAFGQFSVNFDSQRIPLSKSERAKRQGPIPYYGATEVMDYIDDYIFDGEYILVAEDGSVMDKAGFPTIQFIFGKSWVNNHAHVLRAKDEHNNEYLLHSIKRIPVVNIMTGSNQKKITQDNLNNIPLLRPPDDLLLAFSDFAKPIRNKRITLEKEIKELATLRDWLLPMLMNGQVTVAH